METTSKNLDFPYQEECVNLNSSCSDSSNKLKSGNIVKSSACTYFYNYGYCKFGNSCNYKHFRKRTENDKYSTKNHKKSLPQNTCRQKPIENENKVQNSHTQASSKQICRYFKMGNCKKGKQCEFLHSVDLINNEMFSLTVSLHSQNVVRNFFSSDNKTSKKRTIPLCYYFKKGLCYKGDNCKFYHQKKSNLNNCDISSNFPENNDNNSLLPNKNIMHVSENASCCAEKTASSFNRSLNVYNLSSLTMDDTTHLRSIEISQLKKRFPHFEVITDNQTFSILFHPSDPDWAFDVVKLKLQVDFPVNYPTEKCKITVLQHAENIPYLLIKYLNNAISDWIDRRFEENNSSNKAELMFRSFLKWFDKNLEDLFIIGLRKVKQDLKAKEDGIEFVPVENLFTTFEKNSPEKGIEKDNSVVNSQLQEQTFTFDNKNSCQTNQSSKMAYTASNNDTKVIFTDLEFIEGTATFICIKISATLQCCRCKTSFHIKSVPKKNNTHICLKCSKNVDFMFEAFTVHQFSNILGTFHLLDCVAVDINLVECHFLIDCFNCSKQIPVDGIHYGQRHKMWCLFCNGKMMISIGSVKFQTLKQMSIPVTKHPYTKKIEKMCKDPVVKEGEPLPNFGACKHYKKSFRWLRFPCCGRLYPCDECHNEKETDHEMKYASRMICGFCAKEQPYSREKPCLSCSQSLTKKSGAHWEGGKGCRNKIQMSREDKQKYSGINKTVSKRAQNNKPKKKH